MFFFFFEELFYQTKVREAFEKICTKKMLLDGYINMSVYIQGKINKPEMLSLLEKAGSRFSVLYSSSFPKKENVQNGGKIYEKNIWTDHYYKLLYPQLWA